MNRKVNILLVDDNEDSLVALEAILRPLQQRLFKARSGQEAMKLMLRHGFAVVLLDVLMPGMDGFETATHIKRLDQTRDVPIIFLTGTEPSAGGAFRGYAVGAVDYLTKPFDPWVLRSKVAVFIELFRKTAVLVEQTALLTQLVRDHEALGDFARRLGAIETTLTGLADATSGDVGLRDTVKELADQVAAMQAAFDAVSSTGTDGRPQE